MWKIAVVMVVTAVFAGLLIHNPYGLTSESAGPSIGVPPRPANAVLASTQVETPHAQDAPASRPQSIQVVVLKGTADRVPPQGKEYPDVVGTLPDTPIAPVAPPLVPSLSPPPPASNGSQERPVVQSSEQIPEVRPIPVTREDPPPSRVEVPVIIGGTCATGGVIGLDPNGDNFLSVRSGPGGQPFREIDRLFTADAVHVCGRKAPWLAVVYSADRTAQDSCNIGAKGARRSYDGPCKFGWVHSRYIKVSATDSAGAR
jgi:hypothetical protein